MDLKSLTKYQEIFMSFPDVALEALMTSAEEINYKLINEIEYRYIKNISQWHNSLNNILLEHQKKLYEEKRNRYNYLVEGRCNAVVIQCENHTLIRDIIVLLKDNQATMEHQISKLGMDRSFLDYSELLFNDLCQFVLNQDPNLIELQMNSLGVESVLRLLVKKHSNELIERAQQILYTNYLTTYEDVSKQLINELEYKDTRVIKLQYK